MSMRSAGSALFAVQLKCPASQFVNRLEVVQRDGGTQFGQEPPRWRPEAAGQDLPASLLVARSTAAGIEPMLSLNPHSRSVSSPLDGLRTAWMATCP